MGQCINTPSFCRPNSHHQFPPLSCNIIKAFCQEDWQLACNKRGKLRASGGSNFPFSWRMDVKNIQEPYSSETGDNVSEPMWHGELKANIQKRGKVIIYLQVIVWMQCFMFFSWSACSLGSIIKNYLFCQYMCKAFALGICTSEIFGWKVPSCFSNITNSQTPFSNNTSSWCLWVSERSCLFMSSWDHENQSINQSINLFPGTIFDIFTASNSVSSLNLLSKFLPSSAATVPMHPASA